MQAIVGTAHYSEPSVQEHFDRSATLYVDHGLEVYRESVRQRLEMILATKRFVETDALEVLDIGCGGGAFLDMLLARFPNARATGVDISTQMLAGNVASTRKTLLQGDALALPAELGDFDVVCVDTVMHHLIDRHGYEATRTRIASFLSSLHTLLKPGAMLVIREIYHEYRGFDSLGSRAIFAATTARVPAKVERLMRFAGLQTAGVGVCFQTRAQWLALFADAGFAVPVMEDRCWPGQPYRRFGFTQSGDLHYVLTRSRPTL